MFRSAGKRRLTIARENNCGARTAEAMPDVFGCFRHGVTGSLLADQQKLRSHC